MISGEIARRLETGAIVIPLLVDNVLPEVILECTFEELASMFGRFLRTDRRVRLTQRLGQFLEEARQSRIITAVVIDGSFVTAKESPNDIDRVVAYRADFDLRQELHPFEYNVLSRGVLGSRYGFDAFIERDGSDGYRGWIEFFGRIRLDDPEQESNQVRKGLLRISL